MRPVHSMLTSGAMTGQPVEQVRRAVEALLRARQPLLGPDCSPPGCETLYRAACRWIMRLVVILFAEARQLLPVDPPDSLHLLLDQLDRLTPEQRRSRRQAWPRLLALSDPASTRPAQAGGLFCPGDAGGDAVQRALVLLDDLPPPPDDDVVHGLLVLLTRPPRSTREGMVSQPVDFPELTGESLGILYEGLLDCRLQWTEAAPGFLLEHRDGNRKGTGTFYTPTRLTLPTVRRTLEPLLHEGGDRPRLRTPEAILSLKVCDPAMGSGSFLLAALRVLTTAVLESLQAHRRITRIDGGAPTVECALLPEAGPLPAGAGFEEQLAARVRRAVAERCLYGVDLDPLAVELARAALWLETGAPRQPLLDHLRCGDALLGTWLDRCRDHPLLALDRQVSRGVRQRALRELRSRAVEQQVQLLAAADPPGAEALTPVREACDTWCALWFWPLDRLELLPLPGELHAPSPEARAVVQQLRHRLRFFHWELEFPEVFTAGGAGFDAVVGNPPWEIQKPSSKEFFAQHDPRYRSYGKQEALRRQRQLLETDPELAAGWQAHLGFFQDRANFVRHAAEPHGDGRVAGHGGGDVRLARGPQNAALHRAWRARRGLRRGNSDPAHPFRHQGSADLNSYKLFVEAAHALLRDGGTLGMVVPSGLYTDQGTAELRRLLLTRCSWRWLYGFENRHKLFAIDSRFKYCIVIVEKGGRTRVVQAAFLRHDPEDWDSAKGLLAYRAEQVQSFSPDSSTVLEIRCRRDLEVLTRIHAGSVLLGDQGPDGWGIRVTREFDMTNDSGLFWTRDQAVARGFVPELHGRWVNRAGEVLLPLYEGRMIGQFDFSEKGWVSGKGRRAVWREIPWNAKVVEPQYLLPEASFRAALASSGEEENGGSGPKLAFMAIGSATNRRSMFAALVGDVPCGNSVPVIRPRSRLTGSLALAATLNSLTYDFALRARLGGLNLNHFVIAETPVIRPGEAHPAVIAAAARLCLCHPSFAAARAELAASHPALAVPPARWALTAHERLRLRCLLDALLAVLYGLDRDDLAWILRDCDHPKSQLARNSFCRRLDPKGFWRVDRTADPELRHTVLSLAAFDDLQRALAAADERDEGIRTFCDGPDGDGWRLPETLCLAELGLTRTTDVGEYDERARTPQPVRSRLGERFCDGQFPLLDPASASAR